MILSNCSLITWLPNTKHVHKQHVITRLLAFCSGVGGIWFGGKRMQIYDHAWWISTIVVAILDLDQYIFLYNTF